MIFKKLEGNKDESKAREIIERKGIRGMKETKKEEHHSIP
jgi:hypothetical protein